MDVNSGSWLFREEPLEVIKTIFRRALGAETVREARLLDGGLFNTTYLVTYGAGEERAVLRLGPVERHRIMGFEQNLMAAEAYLYAVCRDIGIPCPEVLAWDTSRTAVDRDFMITRYIPSVAMVNAEMTEERRHDLCFQLGAYLRRLHQVTGESFGFVSRVLEGRRFDTWSGAFLFEVEDIVGRLEAFGGLTAGEAGAVLAPFRRSRELLDQVRTPHLLHLDIWAGNVLLDRETLEILAVIDSDRAVFGDPDFEFAAPWMEDPALRRGYAADSTGLSTWPWTPMWVWGSTTTMRCTGTRRKSSWSSWTSEKCSEKNVAKSGGVPELARRRFSLCLIGLPLLGLEPPLLAGVLVGGDVVDALEHLDEVGDVLKAGAAADGLDGFAVGEHEAGVGNAHAVEVVHVGDAGVALEVAAEVVFAVAGHPGGLLNGDLPGVVEVGPDDQLLEAGIFILCVDGGVPVFVHMPGQDVEQPQDLRQALLQGAVVPDEILDDLKNLLVGGVLIQELVQPAAADPQVVLYMDISVHLAKADLKHVHGSIADTDAVGVDGVRWDHKHLPAAQGITIGVNHNFTTQILA